MSTDRFIRFAGALPKRVDVSTAIDDMLAGIGQVAPCREGSPMKWIDVELRGYQSYPFARVGMSTPATRGSWAERVEEPRWIEVYFGDDHISVITRSADEVTSGIADRLAEVIARGWKVVREP